MPRKPPATDDENFIHRQYLAFISAPFLYLSVAVISFVATSWYYQDRIEALKERVEYLKERIDTRDEFERAKKNILRSAPPAIRPQASHISADVTALISAGKGIRESTLKLSDGGKISLTYFPTDNPLNAKRASPEQLRETAIAELLIQTGVATSNYNHVKNSYEITATTEGARLIHTAIEQLGGRE